jgi:sugar/nucleoside kinase (ribokinase family)
MNKYDIYGLGAALVDTEITVGDKDLLEFDIAKGVMTLVDEERQYRLLELLSGHLVHAKRASGGSAANSVIAASYFGSRTFFSCKVAQDDNGIFYLHDLAQAGVDYPTAVVTSEGITGKCLVLITPDAERTMNTFLGISAALSRGEIDFEALQQSRFAYIEGYLVTSETGRPAAIALREAAKSAGVKTAVSLSDSAIVSYFHEGLCQMLGDGVDLLFCNEAEALAFTQCTSLNDACEALKAWTKSFAITCGARGAVVFDGQQQTDVPGVRATAVDTNGAGDMFAGAFLHALVQGADYVAAARFANHAAAQVVSQFGPRLAPEQHAALLADHGF